MMQRVPPRESYDFIRKVVPQALSGVTFEKWSAFLSFMADEHVSADKTAPQDLVVSCARKIGLSVSQVSNMNCAKKCSAIHDRKSPDFERCYEKCLRTGDP